MLYRLLVVVVFLLCSCAGSREYKRVVSTEPLIKQIDVEGNENVSESKIVKHLFAGETTWVPLSPDYPYDEAILASDVERVIELYQSLGFYDAQVEDLQVTEPEPNEFAIKLKIDEGEPTLISSVTYQWSTNVSEELRETVESATTISEKDRFQVHKMNESQGALTQALRNEAFALAEVLASAEVDRDKKGAAIVFRIFPGDPAKVRSVSISGLRRVKQYMVDREVKFAVGEAYTPGLQKQIQSQVTGMGVFSWVAVSHVGEVEDGEIDVVVQVSEANHHRLKIGGALSIDTFRWQEQLRMDYTNLNMFGHLLRLDLTTIVGWAQLPNPFDPILTGPVVRVRPKFTKKGILEEQLLWSLIPEFRVDLRDGYQFYEIGNRFGPSRWFWSKLLLGLYYDTRYDNFFNISPELNSQDSILGRDFRDPYLLMTLHFRAQLYLTDQIRNPNHGTVLESFYHYSAKNIGSDFDFHQYRFKLRNYFMLSEKFQTAFRGMVGFIIPFGEEGSVPFNRWWKLGGSNSVRGWGSRRLAPRVTECNEVGEECRDIPIGGYTFVQGNFELRYQLFKPLRLVAFFDMGDVQSEVTTFKPEEWNYSAGPGLRLKTPLGTVRFDLGFRLNDPGVYPNEAGWSAYVGMGETI